MYFFLWYPFGSLKLLIGFRLNALFSGGLKIFYGSIRVSSLHQKRSVTGAFWLQALISLWQADESVFRTNLYMQHLHSSFWFLVSSKRLTSKCSFYYKPVNYLTVTLYLTFWFHFHTFIENGSSLKLQNL